VERAEARQVNHLLHLLSSDFVRRCQQAGVDTIALGDLTGIRERIDYGKRLNQRLHAWPFAKLTQMITYKAALVGIGVKLVDEAYSSQKCHACGKRRKANRVSRGLYRCACGWCIQADLNGAANLFESAFDVSPLKGASGAVTAPVVRTLWLDPQRLVVCEPASISHRATSGRSAAS
jgi:IS605 OrfB family transposase